MNELAKTIIEDGQDIRPILNYLVETANGLETIKELDRVTFYRRVQASIEHIIKHEPQEDELA